MKIIILSVLLLSSKVFASTVSIAAFTAFYICQNDEGTNHQDSCMISIYHYPNISIQMSKNEGEASLDHSVVELGLNFITNVKVKNVDTKFNISLHTFKDGVEFIGPLNVSVSTISELQMTQLYGKDICVDSKCTRFYRPFLYLSQAWQSE